MATYNGEKYVSEQVDSLLSQTFSDFSLYVQDDASSDGTWDILTTYAEQYPEKIKVSRNRVNSGSAKHNFLEMMCRMQDNYLMLCDQDDVWLPDKIERTLTKMKEMEKEHGTETPILIHSDLTVVDKQLQLINPSYRQAMNSNYNRTALHQVLIQNCITGCTAMYNRSLSALLNRIPVYCIMHDWWLELVAAAFGKIGHIDDQTVLYRQHGKNSIGAKDVRSLSYKVSRLINGKEVRDAIYITYPQAESFLIAYQERLSEDQRETIRNYCGIPKLGKLSRWRRTCELKAFKNGLSRNIAYFIFI